MKLKSALFNYSHFSKPVYLIIRFLLMIDCALLVSSPGFAQSKYLAGNYWIENYGKKQGLPESIIIDITQDRKGYMWMTTPYNLVRFDGYEFKIFNPRKQFPDLYIHFFPGLMEDADGMIWMATNDKGLFSFDPRKLQFRRFYADSTKNGLSNNGINSILEDDAGNLWVGTGNGLNRLSKKGDSISVTQFSSNYSEQLLHTLDRVIIQNQSLSGITKVGDLESRSVAFEIKATAKAFVTCMGEVGDGLADYGWIENDNGTKIWSFDESKSFSAGGAAKNRLQLDIITLPAGMYKLNYISDDSHSWNNWNEAAPSRPDLWGIQLYQLPAALTDTIELSIKTSLANRSTYGSNIKTLLKGPNNTIWALTGAGLEKLTIRDPSTGKFVSEKIALPLDFFPGYFLLELDDDRLIMEGWIYNSTTQKTTVGSLIFNHRKNTFELNNEGLSAYPTSNQKCFLRDKYNNYWMGTFDNPGQGLFISEEGREVPDFKKLEISPPGSGEAGKNSFEQIWTLYQDRSGYIWVGSRQNGLYKIKTRKAPVKYTNIMIPGDDKTKVSITEIEEDAAGDIWLNSKDNGIFKYSRKNKQVSHFPGNNKEPGNTIFFKGKDNALVISENNQTRQYYPEKPGFKSFPVPVPDSLKVVALDDNGNYWAMHKKALRFQNLFYILNGQKFQAVTFDSSALNFGFYRNFHIGRNGNIWVSPAFEGVHQYKLNNQTKKLTYVKRYLPEGVDVYDIYEDEKGLVWSATYDDGLIRLNPENNSFKSFTRNEGLPSNFVFRITPLRNKIWVITDLGSAFFNTENETIHTNKELDEYIAQNTNGSFFRVNYDRGFNDIALRTQSGEIAIAATNGFCIFNPEDIRADTINPILQISNLNVGGRSYEFEKSAGQAGLKLKYYQNDLEIGYIGLHYDQPSKNQYAYLLKGANKDWISAGPDKIARYSNLSPGYYEFYLKSANADGAWSDEQKMFAFTILPPWWRTWWAYTLYAFAFAVAVWSFIAYRSRRLKKENLLLEAKVEQRTAQLNQSLENLKSTQSQLVQSEKMASLGELTAGIAHEIQNPLNFVNNFSEVNAELIDELEEEIDKENTPEAKTIAKNVKDNELKIIFHGKRADAIVKNMLQHSRSSSGKKEPANINALADEYLRLAYHGLRAKDKSFNATMKTDFDESIGHINIIPQDIGRVILNLITNAFYAVTEKKKQQGENYEPTVSVSTKKINDKIEIRVADNGNGIPQKVVDKIFQPFFTTKPTGQGTGLGLSLSYDIVKAHGGELKVETLSAEAAAQAGKEGEGSEFIIQLPVV